MKFSMNITPLQTTICLCFKNPSSISTW